MTNKHLKPGVAVDVRGASDEVKEQVMIAFMLAGANRDCVHRVNNRNQKNYIFWDVDNDVWFSSSAHGHIITINQALGRDSEVENTWVSGVECEASYAGEWYRAKFLSLHETNPHAYAVYLLDSAIDGLNLKWVTKLRPLKTEKDKFVEFALSLDCDPSEGMLSRHDYAARLYDKGLRFIDSKA